MFCVTLKKFLELSDATKSGSITLAEFIHYVKEHEKSLRLSFSNIDKNRDGKQLFNNFKSYNEVKITIYYIMFYNFHVCL